MARMEIHEEVRQRYAEVARRGGMGGCCGPSAEDVARRVGYSDEQVSAVPDGANLGVGCGAPLGAAALRPGETVLDLGSGAGFDALLAARDVGPEGRVIGVDMTEEMLERARANAEKLGLGYVDFRAGRIEDLPVESGAVDVVISNCVINLVPDKAAVFREVARVLASGGRMVVSDVVLDAPLPPLLADDIAAYTGCIAGAAQRADYLEMIRAAGLERVEVLADRDFGDVAASLAPPSLRQQAAEAGIDVAAVARTVRSVTVRAYKS